MKRIFVFVMILALMWAMMIPASAAEPVPEAEDVAAQGSSGAPEDSAPAAEESGASIFTRLIEIWNTYSAELLSGGGIITVVGGLFVAWKKIKPFLLEIVTKLKELLYGESSSGAPTKQSKVLNGIVDGIEDLDKKIEEFQRIVDMINTEKNATKEHFEAVEKALCSLAKALELAYSNSKLPQGVKDLVSLECAACIRTAEEDINGTVASATEEAIVNE